MTAFPFLHHHPHIVIAVSIVVLWPAAVCLIILFLKGASIEDPAPRALPTSVPDETPLTANSVRATLGYTCPCPLCVEWHKELKARITAYEIKNIHELVQARLELEAAAGPSEKIA